MIFTELAIAGCYLIELDRIADERGFFARTWCEHEFAEHGLNTKVAQCSISFNRDKGTLRGMHYQTAPHEEAKLVRCTRGAIYDVLLDLRPGSVTICKWVAKELNEENRHMLYVPEGVAHGFQTLADDTEVFYQMSEFFYPEHAAGVRWNDPEFGIVWPDAERTISARDSQYRDYIP